MALVRDKYEGRQMARVMSFVMTIFILVPVFAPALGQLILKVSGWRSIFGMFLLMSGITLIWFSVRQSETLSPERRIRLSPGQLLRDTWAIAIIPTSTGYTLAMGFSIRSFFWVT